jgi:hypothetical protein
MTNLFAAVIAAALVVLAACAHLSAATVDPTNCVSDCDKAALARHVKPALSCTLPPRRVLPIPNSKRGLAYYASDEIGKPNSNIVLAVSYQHGM